jgi:hypothetical protein
MASPVPSRPRAGRHRRRVSASLVLLITLAMLASCTPGPFSQPTAAPTSTSASPSGAGPSPTSGVEPAVPSTVGGPTTGAEPVADPDHELPELEPVQAPDWKPATRTDELAIAVAGAEITADKPLPTQLAIDVFSVTIAAVPGATPSTLPDGDGLGPMLALELISRVRERLSPAQRAAVDAAVPSGTDVEAHARLDGDGKIVTPVTAGPGKALRAAPRPDPLLARYVGLMAQAAADWKAYRSDVPLPSGIGIRFSQRQIKNYLMTAEPNTTDGTFFCEITVYPDMRTGAPSDQLIKTVFAHEVFHCAQFIWVGNINPALPAWLIEGSATFASFDLYRGSTAPPKDLTDLAWFQDPGKPLAARTYDAWPLYESARQSGADPYAAIKAMTQAGSSSVTASLGAAGLERLDFQAFASSQSLRTNRVTEPTWLMAWPGPNPSAGPRNTGRATQARGIGTFPVLGKGSHTHRQFVVPMTRDVGLVLATGVHGPVQTIADTGTVTIAEGQQRIFCVDPGKCRCPEGTSPTMDAIPLTPPMVFSFPQRDVATNAAVRNMKWDPRKYCEKPQPRKRSAYSNGDPHLVTFDGYTYDLMALGEFVTVRDPRGGLEVQSRHELGRAGSATSAVAIGTGSHRVTADTVLEPKGRLTVRLDGRVMTETAFGAGDVAVTVDGQVLTARWPDGSEVVAHAEYGFFVTITLADDRAGRVVGTLGSADLNMFNDLRMADGAVLTDPDPNAAFADSWAVDERTTLFDYQPGQSPASFRKPLPTPGPDHGPEPDAQAVQTCTERLGEQATSHEIHSCAYDVSVTGHDGFAAVYQQLTDDRVSANAGVVVLVPATPSPTTGPGPEPAVPSGTAPLLELQGTLAFLTDEPGQVPALTGSVRLPAGTVVVARVDLCRPDFDLTVRLVARTEQRESAQTYACDPRGLGTYSAQDGDVVPGTEAYLWVPTAGDYDVTVETTSTDAAAVTVQLFADPTPTFVSAEQFARGGYSGTLDGIGDTLVVPVTSPGGSSQWAVTADGGVCAALEYGPELSQAAPWDLGGVCHRQPAVDLSPTDAPVPLLIFSRSDGPQQVSIRPE